MTKQSPTTRRLRVFWVWRCCDKLHNTEVKLPTMAPYDTDNDSWLTANNINNYWYGPGSTSANHSLNIHWKPIFKVAFGLFRKQFIFINLLEIVAMILPTTVYQMICFSYKWFKLHQDQYCSLAQIYTCGFVLRGWLLKRRTKIARAIKNWPLYSSKRNSAQTVWIIIMMLRDYANMIRAWIVFNCMQKFCFFTGCFCRKHVKSMNSWKRPVTQWMRKRRRRRRVNRVSKCVNVAPAWLE